MSWSVTAEVGTFAVALRVMTQGEEAVAFRRVRVAGERLEALDRLARCDTH